MQGGNMNIPCIRCKGNNPQLYCGRSFCPIIAKSEALFKLKEKLPGENFAGSSHLVCRRFRYPCHVRILSFEEKESGIYDARGSGREKHGNTDSGLPSLTCQLKVYNQIKISQVSRQPGSRMASKL
jgi:hypothetical protein